MSHTPGPWIVYQPESIHTCYEGEDNPATIRAGGTHVATIPGMRPHLTGRSQLNARLIASAPDLLAALESILSSTCGDIGEDGYDGCIRIEAKSLDRAREAIAKATGGVK